MEMDDRLEPGLLSPALQVVHAREVQEEVVAAFRIVAQPFRQRWPFRGRDLERGEIQIHDLDSAGEGSRAETPADLLRGRGQRRRLDRAQAGFPAANFADRLSRDISPERIFRCNSMMPYISSSGVGGQPGT